MKKSTTESLSLGSNICAYFNEYLVHQKAASKNTIESYRYAMNQLLDYVETRFNIKLTEVSYKHFSREIVEDFLSEMENTRKWSTPTRNNKLAAIRSVFKYCAEHDFTVMTLYQNLQLIPEKKVKDHEIEFFSEDALAALLAEPDQKTKKGIRDLVLMILLYDSAARVQELLDIKIKDLHIAKGENPYVILTGKGQKTRRVPLMDKTCEHLRKYIQIFHKDNSGDEYLFYVKWNGSTTKMSKDNVAKIINLYTTSAREKCLDVPEHIYPHMFRHSRAMHLYRNGMDLFTLSQFLGHSDVATTLKFYANADTAMKKEAIDKATSELNPLVAGKISFKFSDDEETLRKLWGLK